MTSMGLTAPAAIRLAILVLHNPVCPRLLLIEAARSLTLASGAQGDSDLQLERMNVYFNEASGGAPVLGNCIKRPRDGRSVKPVHPCLPGCVTPMAFFFRRARTAPDAWPRPYNQMTSRSLKWCRSLCASRGAHGPGARNNGLRALRAVWADLPARQLHLWPGASRGHAAAQSKREAVVPCLYRRRHSLKILQAWQQAMRSVVGRVSRGHLNYHQKHRDRHSVRAKPGNRALQAAERGE